MGKKHITRAVEVPQDILDGIARGLLTASESRLVAAVLANSNHPGCYTGTIQALAQTMRARFKDVYSLVKRLEKAGVLEREHQDTDTPQAEYSIRVLPPALWHA